MRLVYDERIVFGNDRPLGGNIGKQQGVVDDYQMGRRRPFARRTQKADALLPHAPPRRPRLRRQPLPRRGRAATAEVNLRSVAARRGLQPYHRLRQQPRLFHARIRIGAHPIPAAQT